MFSSVLLVQATMGEQLELAMTDPAVSRVLIGGVLHGTLLAAFSMGLAIALRSAALALGVLLPLFLTVSTIVSNIAATARYAQYLPDVAGGLILMSAPPDNTTLTAWSGIAVLAVWAAAAVAIGYLALPYRDVS